MHVVFTKSAITALTAQNTTGVSSILSGALAAMPDLGKGSGPMNYAFDLQARYPE